MFCPQKFSLGSCTTTEIQKITVELNHIPELAVQPWFPKEISIFSALLAQQVRTLHSDNCNPMNLWRTQLTFLRNLRENRMSFCPVYKIKPEVLLLWIPMWWIWKCKVTWWDVRLCTLTTVFRSFKFWSSLRQVPQLPVASSYRTATDELARTNTNLRTKRDLT